jgi:ubiquinone/menaquinone biosynthesis C-methylase UbiE
MTYISLPNIARSMKDLLLLRPKLYDISMSDMEASYLTRWRNELLGTICGDILEVGAGTGASLRSYNITTRSNVILIEPDEAMCHYLAVKSLSQGFQPPLRMSAENLSFPNGSFDYVVSSLVLCTVSNQVKALNEFARILRPEGRIIVIEHILSPRNKRRRFLQHSCKAAWKIIASGCDLCRTTDLTIKKHGFTWERLHYVDIDVGPYLLRSFIIGIAAKDPQT